MFVTPIVNEIKHLAPENRLPVVVIRIFESNGMDRGVNGHAKPGPSSLLGGDSCQLPIPNSQLPLLNGFRERSRRMR